MGRIALWALAASLVAGCATDAQRAQLAANMAEFERTKPKCFDDRSCSRMWSAVQTWVVQNCGMKVQNATDGYIETFGSAQGDTRLACRVVKSPIPPDGYEFVISTGCGNMFGCYPDSWAAALAFNRWVSAQVTTQP